MKKHYLIFALLASQFIISCTKNDGNHGSANLITNPSFETNGDTSFMGWTGSSYSFRDNTPPGGGKWALQLVPEWYGGEGYAEYTITGIKGNFNFNLSCYAKVINWHGSISLRVKKQNGAVINLGETTFSNPDWNVITLIKSTSLEPSDKLLVHLSAGATEIVTGAVLFDNIFLQVNN